VPVTWSFGGLEFIVEELVGELLRVWPDAAPARLGEHDVFRYRYETPAHKFESVVKFVDGPRVIELTARDSFDQRLARFLLDAAAGLDLPALGSGRVRVAAAQFPAGWPFECVVVAPPRVARRFDHQSARLRRVTYWVLPAFAGDFRAGEHGEEFWHQVYRKDGWGVTPVRWDRSRKTRPAWD
jgi:hypothetical protein